MSDAKYKLSASKEAELAELIKPWVKNPGNIPPGFTFTVSYSISPPQTNLVMDTEATEEIPLENSLTLTSGGGEKVSPIKVQARPRRKRALNRKSSVKNLDIATELKIKLKRCGFNNLESIQDKPFRWLQQNGFSPSQAAQIRRAVSSLALK